MAECVVCGDSVAISDACTHCAQPVCAAHRKPAAHDCPGIASDSAQWYTDPDTGRTTGTNGRELSNPRRLATGLVVIAVLALALVAALALAGTADPGRIDDERVEQLVADEVNDARAARGLAPLRANATLAAVADGHSGDMAAREYVDHVAPDGEDLEARYARAGLDCLGGENIYYTPNGDLLITEQALAERIVAEWLRSPGHREALLNDRFSQQGIGVVVSDEGGIYVTQNLC